MNIHQIIISDTANGIGQRVSIFVSGCRNNCKGCHNKEGQNFDYGESFDEATQQKILNNFRKIPVYNGITILGGDPMEPENQMPTLEFIRRFKEEFPSKTVWLYTGRTFEEFLPNGTHYNKTAFELLKSCDVIVDGPFIENKAHPMLNYRGSYNQRIINVKESLNTGTIVERTELYLNEPKLRK